MRVRVCPIATLLTWTEVCGCIILLPSLGRWNPQRIFSFSFPPNLPHPYQLSSLCVINEPEHLHTLLWKSCHFISGSQAALSSAERKPRCYYISSSMQKGGNFSTTKHGFEMLLPFSCRCWGQYFGEWVPVRSRSALLRSLTLLKSSASPQISVTLNGLPVKSQQPGIKPPIFWQPLYSLGSYKALKLIVYNPELNVK